MDEKSLNIVMKKLNESPLRSINLNSQGRRKFFEEEINRVEEIQKVVEGSINNLECPLKIVLMGEVKAGKSTLMNSLVGKEISYMNVVEATATILEVKYSNTEKVVIEKNDFREEVLNSVSDLNKILDQNRNNQEFFEEISKIVVYSPIDRLKEITIVDTPGLNTITRENATRTDDYIVNSDVILWVVNGHHLGQSDINEKINSVMDLGKPIICVINRIDEIDCDVEELIEYVEDEMGYMFTNIFGISAKEALDGVLSKNNDKISNSGFITLNDYLLNNIERNSDEVQKKAIFESISLQLQREINIHNYSLVRLNEILKGISKEIDGIEKFDKTIKISINDKLNHWFEYELLSKEKNSLLYSDKTEDLYNKYFSEKYINDLVQDKYKELGNYTYKQWQLYSDKLIYEKNKSLNQSICLDYIENTISSDKTTSNEFIIEGTTNGAITAGAVGLGLAGYAAWLGPAAAYISIGSAIGAFIPPLLIGGIIGGSVLGLIRKGKNDTDKKEQRNKVIENCINKLKLNIKNSIDTQIIKELSNISEEYKSELIKQSNSVLEQFDISIKEANNISNNISSYIKVIGDIQEIELYKSNNLDAEGEYLDTYLTFNEVAPTLEYLSENELTEEKDFMIKDGKIFTKVIDVNKDNRQEAISDCCRGEELNLVKEHSNHHDKDVIAVYYEKNIIGYISNNLSKILVENINNGLKYKCRILQLTGGGNYQHGLNIVIYKDSDEFILSDADEYDNKFIEVYKYPLNYK